MKSKNSVTEKGVSMETEWLIVWWGWWYIGNFGGGTASYEEDIS